MTRTIRTEQATHHTRFFSPTYPAFGLSNLLHANGVRPSTTTLYDLVLNTGVLVVAGMVRGANYGSFDVDTTDTPVACSLGLPALDNNDDIGLIVAGRILTTAPLKFEQGAAGGSAYGISLTTTGGGAFIRDVSGVTLATPNFNAGVTVKDYILAAKFKNRGGDFEITAKVFDKDGGVLSDVNVTGNTGDNFDVMANFMVLRGRIHVVAVTHPYVPTGLFEDAIDIAAFARQGEPRLPDYWRQRTEAFPPLD